MKSKKRVVKRKTVPQKYIMAVDTGVKWLDLTFGRNNWLRRMNMELFDITNPNTCVAGNVFRDTDFLGGSGFSKFTGLIDDLGGDSNDTTFRFGFDATTTLGQQYLQDLWVMKIKSLKHRHA